MMVFVPLSSSSAHALRDATPPGPCRGFAVTAGLRGWVGADATEEEADFAALSAAGTAALDGLAGARRLVLAAEVAAEQVREGGGGVGEVVVDRLRWPQVSALFADEESAGPAVLAAAAAATGRSLSEALDLPAVAELTDSHDLLWFAPEELDDLS